MLLIVSCLVLQATSLERGTAALQAFDVKEAEKMRAKLDALNMAMRV